MRGPYAKQQSPFKVSSLLRCLALSPLAAKM